MPSGRPRLAEFYGSGSLDRRAAICHLPREEPSRVSSLAPARRVRTRVGPGHGPAFPSLASAPRGPEGAPSGARPTRLCAQLLRWESPARQPAGPQGPCEGWVCVGTPAYRLRICASTQHGFILPHPPRDESTSRNSRTTLRPHRRGPPRAHATDGLLLGVY